MLKLFISIFAVFLSYCTFSQWVTKKVDNGFDPIYTIAYTDDGQGVYLKLENYEGISFYLSNTYVCEDELLVDISFFVNGEYQKYLVNATVSDNKKTVFLVPDLSEDKDLLSDFKASTKVKIRVNDNVCDTEIFEFKMTGSTSAYEAVLKQ